jgi:hypothetical protein
MITPTVVPLMVLVLLRACHTVDAYEVPSGSSVESVAEGVWDWAGRDGTCRDNPHTISFSPDQRYMVLTFPHPIDSATGKREARYEIRGQTRNSIRGFIIDETRRTEGGELVVWDLVLTSPNSYRWHRTDWAAGSYTAEVIRCRGR